MGPGRLSLVGDGFLAPRIAAVLNQSTASRAPLCPHSRPRTPRSIRPNGAGAPLAAESCVPPAVCQPGGARCLESTVAFRRPSLSLSLMGGREGPLFPPSACAPSADREVVDVAEQQLVRHVVICADH